MNARARGLGRQGAERGLVLVRTTYTIAMADLRRSRLRTGATDWSLYQDGQNPRVFIELFSVPSWEEHLRQHRERLTGTDQQYHDAAAALSDPPPQTDHHLAAAVHKWPGPVPERRREAYYGIGRASGIDRVKTALAFEQDRRLR